MATRPELIFCFGGNKRFVDVALQSGFRYGARLPSAILPYPLYFADQDWRRPDRAAYVAALDRYRPIMATVLDWERDEQLTEVLDWAEEASHYTQMVVIVPKVRGGVAGLPRAINGRPVVVGYSVPSRYGSSSVPLQELAGRQVHLPGGSPQRQMELWYFLRRSSEIVSVDGNVAQKLAGNGQFWVSRPVLGCSHPFWPTLREVGEQVAADMPYEAFRRSCANIRDGWEELAATAARTTVRIVEQVTL